MEDLSGIVHYDETLEEMMSNTLNDPGDETGLYAIAAPGSNGIIYSSALYQKFFSSFEETPAKGVDFSTVNIEITYQFIIQQFYGLTLIANNTLVCPLIEKASGLRKFIEFELVPDFTSVMLRGELPELDTDSLIKLFNQLRSGDLMNDVLPLGLFTLDGIVIIKVRDVTGRETLGAIKNILVGMPYLGDLKSFFNCNRKSVTSLNFLPQVSALLRL